MQRLMPLAALTLGAVLSTGCSDTVAADLSPRTAAAAAAAALSGTWTLNVEASTLPRPADHPPQHAEPPRMRGPAGPDGGPGIRGPGGRPGGPGLPRGAGQLAIAQTDSTVTFRRGPHMALTLYTDGRIVTRDHGPVGVELSARWDGEVLVVTHRGPEGRGAVETYRIEGEQLVQTVTLSLPEGEEHGFRMVYDRA